MCACVALHTCTLTLGEEKWRWWWWWWRKRWRRRRKFYLNAIIKIHIECLTLAAKNTTMQVHIETQREGENATDLSTMNYVYVTEWIITLTALSSLYTFNKLLCINDFRKCCRLQFGILMLRIRWKSLTEWIQVKFIQVDLAACFLSNRKLPSTIVCYSECNKNEHNFPITCVHRKRHQRYHPFKRYLFAFLI